MGESAIYLALHTKTGAGWPDRVMQGQTILTVM
jgi:hypothetical protein